MDIKKVKVVLLAAGFGKRLQPLTNTVPKVMVEIAPGLPLLEHHILQLKAHEFSDFIINLHYLPKVITDYCGDGSRWGVSIAYSDESDKILETAGALKKIGDALSDPFVLIFADVLNFIDFHKVLDVHISRNAFATIVLRRNDIPQNGDVAELDFSTGRIVKWYGRPHDITDFGGNKYLNGGFYVLSKEILECIPDGVSSLDRDILPKVFKERTDIYGVVSPEPIYDIGTMEKLEAARKYFAEKTKNKTV